jgi:hypothetical protein
MFCAAEVDSLVPAAASCSAAKVGTLLAGNGDDIADCTTGVASLAQD